ncbi:MULTISPECIES: aminomethyl-transferring glycine dehydrogenase subunit GcvPB [Limnochorda]|uniref:aminomethyl-transferring glycine dehydrogenase subunit GcvPB n=1 Tax=Limnochorda TaxID=1676651 RepID=UPI001E1896C9|nr:aminomethyl-transferring glycine dehydrogenase subunit GcvPB [Limnochorda pilosa]MBO2486042.1 glycine dehydrogenase (aminomethyl-transferring) [Bacillota bacterium]MBO2519022.1 glycine dehydrogenase (aminomethyl-transferring) [Bacillota bacterium]
MDGKTQSPPAIPHRPEPLIFERGAPGRRALDLPAPDGPLPELDRLVPASLRREAPPALPEVSEPEVVRHYTRLSQRNFSVDTGFYPLGSCTMKYNPKVHEEFVSLPGFSRLHPYQPAETVQGALRLMWELEQWLCEISGLHRATFQPAAGAHGELTGLMLIKAYHAAHAQPGAPPRDEILIPDSAHGTNPASASMAGYRVVEIPSDARGGMDLDVLRRSVGPRTAGLMLTNPNTLGLYDENILEIAALVHEAGGLLYYDGANANAILGISRPGDMGFDIVHFNLHKTFSTPHGGGGPGAGPIVVTEKLAPFLPVPLVEKEGDRFRLVYDRPQSIGQVRAFYGHFGVLVRAYAYILAMGPEGLRQVSEDAVLNANYLLSRLREHFAVPYDRPCMHEFVVSAAPWRRLGVRGLDIAKRLLDYGFHPPTVSFPLVVEEALMVEPTETETLETLDAFADAVAAIRQEAETDPDLLREAPHRTVVRRLDEAGAARRPNLCWPLAGGELTP